jgi:glutamate synthase domain-containing protein 2
MCSGEGGILASSIDNAHKYIFEYVPNRYSVSDENLKRVDAIEIKFGQSAKPGMGGHLPGSKVTPEIAEIRGFEPGESITSPARFDDIRNKAELKAKIDWLRDASGGRPIGVKFAAGNIEADLETALYAQPDFITLDGRAGATGAAPKYVKAATSVPTIFALHRARRFLDNHDARQISLVITGGIRVSADIAKALAMGADAVAIGTAALMAIGCQQYKICNTGKCPMGIATQDAALRANLNVSKSARRLENFLNVITNELIDFARLTGNTSVHGLSIFDLCTVSSEISNHTSIEHV